MGILDGFAGGFWGDVDAERERQQKQDDLNRQNERNVLTSLVNSPDVNDTVRKYALTGLLESVSTTSKKKKGLHGFFGEMEKSDVLPHVSSLIDQMEAAGQAQQKPQGPQAQPNLPSGHLNAQGMQAAAQAAPNVTPQSFPSAAGAPPTMAPAPPARGAAAMPAESPVTGGDIHPSAAGVPGTQPSLGMLPQVPGFQTPSFGPSDAARAAAVSSAPGSVIGAPPPSVTPSNGPPTPSMASAAAPTPQGVAPAPAALTGAPVGAPPPSTSAFGAVQPPKPTPADARGPQAGSGLDSKVFISPDERHILGMQTALKESGLYTDDEIKQIMRDNLDRYYGRTSGGGAGVGGTWSKGPLLQKPTGEWVQQLYLRGDPNQVKEIPAMDPRALSVGAVTPQEQAAADLFGQPGENPKVAYMRILRDGSGDQIDQINQKVNAIAAANKTATTVAEKTAANANTLIPPEYSSANGIEGSMTYGELPDGVHLISPEQRTAHDSAMLLKANIADIEKILPLVLKPGANPMSNWMQLRKDGFLNEENFAALQSLVAQSSIMALRAVATNKGQTSERDAEAGHEMIADLKGGLTSMADNYASASARMLMTKRSIDRMLTLNKTATEQIEEKKAAEQADRAARTGNGTANPVAIAPASSATPGAAPAPAAPSAAPAATPTATPTAPPMAPSTPQNGKTATRAEAIAFGAAKVPPLKPDDAVAYMQNVLHYKIVG